MLKYNSRLKQPARTLRTHMTDSEQLLWSRLRRRQMGVQFYRQKPIGNFIVDFYAPAAGLVVEVDGSQHLEREQAEHDECRTVYLETRGLRVLRFDNREVLKSLDAVAQEISTAVQEATRSH